MYFNLTIIVGMHVFVVLSTQKKYNREQMQMHNLPSPNHIRSQEPTNIVDYNALFWPNSLYSAQSMKLACFRLALGISVRSVPVWPPALTDQFG